MTTGTTSDTNPLHGFITRWADSGASKRANCQPFLSELCALLGQPRLDDNYGCHVLEARQFADNAPSEPMTGSTGFQPMIPEPHGLEARATPGRQSATSSPPTTVFPSTPLLTP